MLVELLRTLGVLSLGMSCIQFMVYHNKKTEEKNQKITTACMPSRSTITKHMSFDIETISKN